MFRGPSILCNLTVMNKGSDLWIYQYVGIMDVRIYVNKYFKCAGLWSVQIAGIM